MIKKLDEIAFRKISTVFVTQVTKNDFSNSV